jgi:hypothetical protein
VVDAAASQIADLKGGHRCNRNQEYPTTIDAYDLGCERG